jgi:hypothetical protein
MVDTESNRHSLETLKQQLGLDYINIENEMFVKREIVYNYNEDQFFCDLMDIEDTYYEEFSFRIRKKKEGLPQLSFYPNYIVYIYNKQYGMEVETRSENESMEAEFEDMGI